MGDPLSTQMLTLHDPGELAPHLFAAPPQFIHRLYGQIWDNRPCLTFDNHWCVYRTGVFAQRHPPSIRREESPPVLGLPFQDFIFLSSNFLVETFPRKSDSVSPSPRHLNFFPGCLSSCTCLFVSLCLFAPVCLPGRPLGGGDDTHTSECYPETDSWFGPPRL